MAVLWKWWAFIFGPLQALSLNVNLNGSFSILVTGRSFCWPVLFSCSFSSRLSEYKITVKPCDRMYWNLMSSIFDDCCWGFLIHCLSKATALFFDPSQCEFNVFIFLSLKTHNYCDSFEYPQMESIQDVMHPLWAEGSSHLLWSMIFICATYLSMTLLRWKQWSGSSAPTRLI